MSAFRPLTCPITRLTSLQIGHLEATAGLAGIIKSIYILENAIIPPNIHFHQANPRIPFDEWNIEVPTKVMPWPAEGQRRISVSLPMLGMAPRHADVKTIGSRLRLRRDKCPCYSRRCLPLPGKAEAERQSFHQKLYFNSFQWGSWTSPKPANYPLDKSSKNEAQSEPKEAQALRRQCSRPGWSQSPEKISFHISAESPRRSYTSKRRIPSRPGFYVGPQTLAVGMEDLSDRFISR